MDDKLRISVCVYVCVCLFAALSYTRLCRFVEQLKDSMDYIFCAKLFSQQQLSKQREEGEQV